jgi:four helix bundle protein
MVPSRHFDHEKLDVYQLELKFLTWVTQFLADISGPSLAQTRELREQLDRASLSALLNTAEGNGKRQGRQRAKFFDDARGSAIECAACLDASVAKGFVCSEQIQPGKEMLVRIVAMLTKLVMRFDPEQYRVREGALGLTAAFEDEHDDEDEHENKHKEV